MKRLRLLRWSGSVLSPQTRPYYFHQIAFNLRLQSNISAPIQQVFDDTDAPPSLPNSDEVDLRRLPSPPTSRALLSAKLSALHARLALPSRLPIQTLARCLVDATADSDLNFNNTHLSVLGNDLLGHYTSEAILCRYPRLPMPIVYSAMHAYCGPKTLAAITREWGVDIAAEPGGEVDPGYLQLRRVEAGNAAVGNTGVQWKEVAEQGKMPHARKVWNRGMSSRSVYDDYFGELEKRAKVDYAERPELKELDKRGAQESGTTVENASTTFVRAVMAAVYLHAGRRAAEIFFKEHIMSRHVDVGKMFEFRQPTRDVSRLCAREGFDNPIARILSETGRNTRHPVFVVGVFSGRDKLGEAAGGSLDEARIRAAVAALKGWYLYSPLEVRVPSETEGDSTKPWTPVLIDVGEVVV
ncbi:hypothetical protein MMC06_002944 [Schaereria dolodes]|nr:hypothetical protein [Schaereria dolodes]